ncbi:MAG: helix-hairpin-helix domain-containing protein, partial [Myxococcaceae bacterium]
MNHKTISLLSWLLILGVLNFLSTEKLPILAGVQFKKIDLNKAQLEDLMQIPKLQFKVAQSILKERERRGCFKNFEELKAISGVGVKTLEKLTMWAIIGGSGFENFPEFEILEDLERETPFGLASSGAKKIRLAGEEILFISRHGRSHELLPSEVNYQANIFLLKKLGATKILAISSVGSLREELKPGDLVVPTQYIDRTKSIRQHTFAGNGLVSHVSLADPVSLGLVDELKKQTPKFDFDSHFDRTSIIIEGPGFSTRAEANYYQKIGADIIGMTAFPEYALAREAGMHYLPCSF